MTSESKAAANRANAKKSTGPKTSRGKSITRFNALQYGVHGAASLHPGEDTEAYAELVSSVFDHCKPIGPIEGVVAHRIVDCIWRLGRLDKAGYAALKRTAIGIMFAEVTGYTSLNDAPKVDAFVRDELADEEIGRSLDENDNRAGGEETGRDDVTAIARVPALSYIFLQSYGSTDSGPSSAEIDRQVRAVTRDLLRLEAAFDQMQHRRMAHTVLPIEANK